MFLMLPLVQKKSRRLSEWRPQPPPLQGGVKGAQAVRPVFYTQLSKLGSLISIV